MKNSENSDNIENNLNNIDRKKKHAENDNFKYFNHFNHIIDFKVIKFTVYTFNKVKLQWYTLGVKRCELRKVTSTIGMCYIESIL